jgi:hypothetical protein
MSRQQSNLLIPIVSALFLFLDIAPPAPARPEPPMHPRTILPGVGLRNCKIGAPIQDARELFGKPSSQTDGHIQFADRGVEVAIDKGKVRVLFFHFRSRDHKTYAGKTDKGIGKDSSMEDVTKQYGKPDRITESIVSEFGPQPGAREHYLLYEKQGTAFTFYDKQLADVRVFAKER